MIYFLIGAGIVVVALCLHYSTASYGTEETDVSPACFDNGFDDSNFGSFRSDDDPCTDPDYASLSCNIFHDDC